MFVRRKFREISGLSLVHLYELPIACSHPSLVGIHMKVFIFYFIYLLIYTPIGDDRRERYYLKLEIYFLIVLQRGNELE